MQLRPPEFEIDDDQKPFDNDRLSRRPRIEALTRVIVAEDGPAVISVNAGFGTGKSAFMRMLAANLRLQDGVEVQEFNAWQQSYTDDPLVDLVYGRGVPQAAQRTTVMALLPAFPALPGMAGHIFGWSMGKPIRWRAEEKGIDVMMALDIAIGARDDLYDVAVVMSADSDLVPAIEVALAAGKRVETAMWWSPTDRRRRMRVPGRRLWNHALDAHRFARVRDDTDYTVTP